MPERRPRIVLHRAMDEVEARCVLAEAARDAAGRLRYSLAEAKALRWAVDHLMPTEEVAAQLAAGARPQDLMTAWKLVSYRLQTLPAGLVVALRSA